MIKPETIGYLDVAKLNSVMTREADTKNYDFIEDENGTWLVLNELNGHDTYVEDSVIPAGAFLNAYSVESLAGLRLIVDMKHLTNDDVNVGDTLIVNARGSLDVDSPVDGKPHFEVEEKCYLTMPAVKVRVKM